MVEAEGKMHAQFEHMINDDDGEQVDSLPVLSVCHLQQVVL